jgi:sarcosine oxidase subunit beta
MLVPTEPFDKVAHTAPMTIDMSTGFHFRPEGRGLLLAWNDPEETSGFKTHFERSFVEKILTRAVDRVPVFEETGGKSVACLGRSLRDDPRPSPHPRPRARRPRILLRQRIQRTRSNAFAATGKILADLILKSDTDLIDARLLNFERFAEGREIHETAVL